MAFTKINAAGIGTTETVTVDGLTVINDGSFGGNLTVSGVLTYEDVTNVDSVGLITARNGVVVGSGITLSKDGDIFATGITTVSGNVKVGTGITLSPDGDIEIGFIADEVINIIPEIVPTAEKSLFTKNEEDTEIVPSYVEYKRLTSVLTKAVQELSAKVETLEAEIAALKSN